MRFKFLISLVFISFITISCNNASNDDGNNNGWNSGNNYHNEICDNGVDDDNDGAADCADSDCYVDPACQNNNNNVNNNNNNNNNIVQMFTLTGKVWAPGADDPNVMEVNKVPMYGALVAAYTSPPDALPQGCYCNECIDTTNLKYTTSAADGSFELQLYPNQRYWLVVQKGDFRRVTEYMAGGPGETDDLEPPAGQPRNSVTTLPNHNDPANGANIPKILVVKGAYEDMSVMFGSLGFNYGVEIDEISDVEMESIASNINSLKQYNLIVTTCGKDAVFLTDQTVRDNLRQFVHDGGKLYVDDFSYDFAEQPFPEFLIFNDGNTNSCGSGTTPPGTVGTCNHWSSYDPSGEPGDPYFEDWLNVINPSGNIQLQAAWDIISNMGSGIQGECNSDSDPNCVDGIYTAPPKVWMYGNWSGYTHNPVTVSWNYYCGRVLYTVYHTHSGDAPSNPYEYALLLQEKIMLYLIMEIQTCKSNDIVG